MRPLDCESGYIWFGDSHYLLILCLPGNTIAFPFVLFCVLKAWLGFRPVGECQPSVGVCLGSQPSIRLRPQECDQEGNYRNPQTQYIMVENKGITGNLFEKQSLYRTSHKQAQRRESTNFNVKYLARVAIDLIAPECFKM